MEHTGFYHLKVQSDLCLLHPFSWAQWDEGGVRESAGTQCVERRWAERDEKKVESQKLPSRVRNRGLSPTDKFPNGCDALLSCCCFSKVESVWGQTQLSAPRQPVCFNRRLHSKPLE